MQHYLSWREGLIPCCQWRRVNIISSSSRPLISAIVVALSEPSNVIYRIRYSAIHETTSSSSANDSATYRPKPASQNWKLVDSRFRPSVQSTMCTLANQNLGGINVGLVVFAVMLLPLSNLHDVGYTTQPIM